MSIIHFPEKEEYPKKVRRAISLEFNGIIKDAHKNSGGKNLGILGMRLPTVDPMRPVKINRTTKISPVPTVSDN